MSELATMSEQARIVFSGRLRTDSFIEFARHRAARLGLEIDVAQMSKAAWVEGNAQQSVNAIACGEFTDQELRDALSRLREHSSVVIDTDQLSPTVVNQLRDPYIMTAIAEAVRQGWPPIPGAGVFYESRLTSRPENANQRLNVAGQIGGTGLRFLPVKHDARQSDSPEEAKKVAELVEALLRKATWTDKQGQIGLVTLEDILIVAPYNAQVSLLLRELPKGSRVGTVDKFQGQEAPVVIYSMATSTPQDAPRGMEFLYSGNRLNVATSRAQCVTVLVASPALFDVQCKTPRQMELANAFCRYLEMAQTI